MAKDLGLDPNKVNPFGNVYFDLSGNTPVRRNTFSFEKERMPDDVRKREFSIPAWLLRGAIREDDVLPAFGDNPQDDPRGNFNRVCGHFFDPFNNRGLSSTIAVVLCGAAPQTKAPDWALGSFDAFAQPSQPNPGRRNHFTVLDARLAMYNALTGNGSNPDPRTETSRNAWWATTFRALGDVVHLLQDMAQPQHTRNEAHPSLFETGYYEQYIEARAKSLDGEKSVRLNGEIVPTKPLNFGNYPKPTFTRYSDFFATNPGGNGVLAGKGLAEYSNRGFFTDDHNFGSDAAREYPAPSGNRADYEEETATFPDLLQNGVQVKFLRGVVPDTQIGGASPIRT